MDRCLLCSKNVESKIISQTQLIFHNNHCGYPGYIDEIKALGKKYKIIVIDDFPCVLRKEKIGSNRIFVHIVKYQLDLSNIPTEHHEDAIKTRFVDGVEFTVDVICGDDHIPLSIAPRLRIVVIHGMVHHAKIVTNNIFSKDNRSCN